MSHRGVFEEGIRRARQEVANPVVLPVRRLPCQAAIWQPGRTLLADCRVFDLFGPLAVGPRDPHARGSAAARDESQLSSVGRPDRPGSISQAFRLAAADRNLDHLCSELGTGRARNPQPIRRYRWKKEVQVAMSQRRRLCRRSRDVQLPEAVETGSPPVEQPPAVSRHGASVPHHGGRQPAQDTRAPPQGRGISARAGDPTSHAGPASRTPRPKRARST